MSEEKNDLLNLGAWLGRHQAFGMIANRCSAADAECLKTIRDGGEYKQLGLSWEQFCVQHAGVSRVYAERQIRCVEEFGANYFRLSEVTPISPGTYRLIAGAVSDQGLECEGERIPLEQGNRRRLAAAVSSMRSKAETRNTRETTQVTVLRKRMRTLVKDTRQAAGRAESRDALIAMLEEGESSMRQLAVSLR